MKFNQWRSQGGARPPPPKLGSQENSWLRRLANYTKLCIVLQPNILNNCYELSGGYAPRTTHQGLCPWTPLGDFRSPDPLCHPPPNPGYATVLNILKRKLPGLDSSLALDYCACYQVFVCMFLYLSITYSHR